MRELVHAVGYLTVLIDKLVKAIVHRRTADTLCGIVQLHDDVALFQDDGHDAFVAHIEISHADRVQQTREVELSMHHVTRVDGFHFTVFQCFQI